MTQKIEEAINELRRLKLNNVIDIEDLIAAARESQERIENARRILSGETRAS